MGLGYLASGIGFAILFATPGLARRFAGLNPVLAFWTAYVLTRPFGASVADWIAVRPATASPAAVSPAAVSPAAVSTAVEGAPRLPASEVLLAGRWQGRLRYLRSAIFCRRARRSAEPDRPSDSSSAARRGSLTSARVSGTTTARTPIPMNNHNPRENTPASRHTRRVMMA